MLSNQQLHQFNDDGFLCIEGVLSEADRAPVIEEYHELLGSLERRFAMQPDDNTDALEQYSFDSRYTRLIQRYPEAYEHLDISLPMSESLAADAGFHAGPAVFSLLTHSGVLDIAEQVVGPEVFSNPVQHVRIKPPESLLDATGRGNSNIARTYWHQDAAVVLQEAEQTPVLTVWVAMTDANPQNGCMNAIRGSHRWDSLAVHCPGKTGVGEIYIPEVLAASHDSVPLEVKAGGIVLLHQKTWHGAGPNNSDSLRWSFDLRYQPPGMLTGRDFFPGFLARSRLSPQKVLRDPDQWRALWLHARDNIASGRTQAVFNTRWQPFHNHHLCA